MSSLSERVYNILLDNSQRPVKDRATLITSGGSMDRLYHEGGPVGYTVEASISDSRRRSSNKRKLHNVPKVDIEEYDMEMLPSENIESNKYLNGGMMCPRCAMCPLCSGTMGGSLVKNQKKGSKVYKKPMAMASGGMVQKQKSKPKKKLPDGLKEYQEGLNKLKDKGLTHKEAQKVMKQVKQEFGNYSALDEMSGGKHGRRARKFFRDFAHGFEKGFTGTAKTLAPLVPLML